MFQFQVRSKTSTYPVWVGSRAWHALGDFLRRADYSSVFIATEPGIWKSWQGEFLQATGLHSGAEILIPSGERSKSLTRLRALAGELLNRRADRQSALIALGGGVVGDLAGFAGSVYMRGIDTLQAPTTLVGQIDSALGGKTGVNLPGAKNILGTVTPPRLVAANPQVLRSLSPRAFRSGLYEVIKHGIILDVPLFRFVKRNLESILGQDPQVMETLVARAARVKIRVVSRDERETGLRRILNFGHTLGHALEAGTHYRRFLHGEAVGWGMILATRIARAKGLLSPRDEVEILELIRSVGPLPSLAGLKARQLVTLLSRDKKTVRGVVHWILPEKIGAVRVVTDISTAEVEKAFRDAQHLSR